MVYSSPSFWKLIVRGFRRRCPRCGQGKLFQKWYRLKSDCDVCHLHFLKDPVDILAFMYLSTAFLTGLFVLLMFWLAPSAQMVGRIFLLIGALTIMSLSSPYRKGVAIALEYWSECKLNQN